MSIERRAFDWSSQERFANVCGDLNPIHLDPVAARRTLSGACIVHGMHSLLWLLDCIARVVDSTSAATGLKAQFLQPVYVGEELACEIQQTHPSIQARVLAGQEPVLAATLTFDSTRRNPLPWSHAHAEVSEPPASPRELTLAQMAGCAGSLKFPFNIAALGEIFPAAAKALGLNKIAALAITSSIVGMVVPGLHSMYSGLDVTFQDNASDQANTIRFTVTSVSERFRLVRIGISARGLQGTLETINRMPPVKQPGMQHAARIVAREEFRGANVLIAGGSRGLGEVTAKLIASGGGRVFITYAAGPSDAAAVAAEIGKSGHDCHVFALDVLQPAYPQLAALPQSPTHMYYFSTPPIFRRQLGVFNRDRLNQFTDFYVHGFLDVLEACLRIGSESLTVFYPSSTALDDRPEGMTEYSMAKAAGEVLCADLSRALPGVHIVTQRLPRLITDQTNSTMQVKSVGPMEIMLPLVRRVQQHRLTR